MSAIKTSLCKTVPGTLFISTALGTEMRRPGDRVTENVSFPLFPSKLTFGSVHVALGDMCRKVSTSLEERIDPDTYHWRGKHDPPIFVSDLPFPAHL